MYELKVKFLEKLLIFVILCMLINFNWSRIQTNFSFFRNAICRKICVKILFLTLFDLLYYFIYALVISVMCVGKSSFNLGKYWMVLFSTLDFLFHL